VRRDRTSDRQMRQTTFLGLRPDKDGVWENGEWSSAIAPKGEDCGPRQIRGYLDRLKSVRAILGGYAWLPIT
jgi:hypothetical protein